ncbi:hypothetical protein WDU94_000036 [Cyamophila willieti]
MSKDDIIRDEEEILNILNYMDGNESDDMMEDDEDNGDELQLLLHYNNCDMEMDMDVDLENILQRGLGDESTNQEEVRNDPNELLDSISMEVHEAENILVEENIAPENLVIPTLKYKCSLFSFYF